MAGLTTKRSTSTDLPCPDCSAFLDWDEEELDSFDERVVVFRSLVASLNCQPALDDSLEAKAVNLLKSVVPKNRESADSILSSFKSIPDEYSINLVQSFVVLISTSSLAIIAVSMKILNDLLWYNSTNDLLAVVRADLITQIINTLNPLSLSFAEAEDIHVNLLKTITRPVRLSTPDGFPKLQNSHDDDQQAVHETVLTQVLAPSAKYIWHLCVNRYSIIEVNLSAYFLALLTRILHTSPYYHPTLEFVLNMPVILTIPSCLTFLENARSIWDFMTQMIDIQQEWNNTWGEVRQMWRTVVRMLRMEGFEDVMEEKLRNVETTAFGGWIIANSIKWSNMQGMNLLQRW
ncbi:hypothetical protein BLNAU_12322 [Blattamonas nauphoetae]|uniref:Uncharacterized protein n=1 Tax=Blattamonas nauphoetae TaxID=2049346 RepID=A0ABQ9XJR4_9EUKA|nr:hypothetical protein BLNAU_12322 [Blattamonas nauphoetae]